MADEEQRRIDYGLQGASWTQWLGLASATAETAKPFVTLAEAYEHPAQWAIEHVLSLVGVAPAIAEAVSGRFTDNEKLNRIVHEISWAKNLGEMAGLLLLPEITVPVLLFEGTKLISSTATLADDIRPGWYLTKETTNRSSDNPPAKREALECSPADFGYDRPASGTITNLPSEPESSGPQCSSSSKDEWTRELWTDVIWHDDPREDKPHMSTKSDDAQKAEERAMGRAYEAVMEQHQRDAIPLSQQPHNTNELANTPEMRGDAQIKDHTAFEELKPHAKNKETHAKESSTAHKDGPILWQEWNRTDHHGKGEVKPETQEPHREAPENKHQHNETPPHAPRAKETPVKQGDAADAAPHTKDSPEGTKVVKDSSKTPVGAQRPELGESPNPQAELQTPGAQPNSVTSLITAPSQANSTSEDTSTADRLSPSALAVLQSINGEEESPGLDTSTADRLSPSALAVLQSINGEEESPDLDTSTADRLSPSALAVLQSINGEQESPGLNADQVGLKQPNREAGSGEHTPQPSEDGSLSGPDPSESVSTTAPAPEPETPIVAAVM